MVVDKNNYKSRSHSILNRHGEIIKIVDSGVYAGKVYVRWVPKTKRGTPESFHHLPYELEVVSHINNN